MIFSKRRRRRHVMLVSVDEASTKHNSNEAKLLITKFDDRSKKDFIKTNWGRKIYRGGG
jgi:hypothetical protein